MTKEEAKQLDAIEVCARLPEEAFQYAKIVGAWVWVAFPGKPAVETRAAMVDLGFRWNPKRATWQHACGVKSKRLRTGDPRDKYGEISVADMIA